MRCNSRLLFAFILLLSLFLYGCGEPLKPVSNLPKLQSGQIAYEVPKGVDLTEIISGVSSSQEKEVIYGHLMMPETSKGKTPAVIIMHASGGVFDWREFKAAEALNQKGVAAFIPYSFEARGIYDTNKTAGTGVTWGMRLTDAYRALELLSTHPDIDNKKIGIMGYSSGGVVSLLSADKAVSSKLSPSGLSFAAHVNVYASVTFAFAEPNPTGAPMLFLMGEKDDVCPMAMVKAYADKLRSKGLDVSSIVYPGAYHVFDSPNPVKHLAGYDNDSRCQFLIQPNGMLLDPASGKTFSERDWPKHTKPCTIAGVHFGRNEEAAEKYLEDAVSFFVKNLE